MCSPARSSGSANASRDQDFNANVARTICASCARDDGFGRNGRSVLAPEIAIPGTITPDVTDTRLVPEIECEAKHITAVCDIHRDPSHPVSPTLATSDIEYRLHPFPATVTHTAPACPMLAPLPALTPTPSTVNTSDWLPTRCPAVTDTRLVPPP